MKINGIKVTVMKYSNKGVIVLFEYNGQTIRVIVILTDKLSVRVEED